MCGLRWSDQDHARSVGSKSKTDPELAHIDWWIKPAGNSTDHVKNHMRTGSEAIAARHLFATYIL